MTETPAARAEDVEARLADLPPLAGVGETLRRLRESVPLEELPGLLRSLCAEHPSPKVRFHAERVLRHVPGRPASPDLGDPLDPRKVARALGDPDADVRLAAAAAVPRLPKPKARVVLRRALERGEADSWVLATLLALLGELGDAGLAEWAALHLDHGSPRVEANALHALHRLEPRAALHAAYPRLSSEDNRVRGNAILALRPFNEELAWRHVRDMGLDPSPWMRASACYLAATLGHAEAEGLLLEILRREKHPELLLRGMRWLEAKGTAESLGALSYLATEAPPPLDAAARRALEAVRARTTDGGGDLQGRADAFERRREVSLPCGPALNSRELAEAAEAAEAAERPGTLDLPSPTRRGAPSPSADASPSAPGTRPREDTPVEAVASLVEALERAGGDASDPVATAYALLRQGDAERAAEILQGSLPVDGGEAPGPVRCALALALLALGETGLATRQAEKLDADAAPLDELYALGRALEELGAHATAGQVYEEIRGRRLSYRDVRERLDSLERGPGALAEKVRMVLSADYRDLKLIGRGGMGQVFHGVARASGRPVALKVPDHRLLADASTLERFRRECESLSSLEHPHVIEVLEVGRGEVPFYAMELVTGRSLADLLEQRAPLPARECERLFTALAGALGAVHGQGIVHRDFKPDNVLLREDGAPVLADFGVAFVEQQEALTNTGMMVGTLGYMAPEQIAGDAPTPAADVYAFGASLFEALTGALPFEASGAMLKLYRDAPRASTRIPKVPPLLDALVHDCLQRPPEARPPDGAALLTRLQE